MLESLSEVRRCKLTNEEAYILAVIGKIGSGKNADIRALIPAKSAAALSSQLRALKKKGFVRSTRIGKGDDFEWPTYTLTDKAKAFGKGEG